MTERDPLIRAALEAVVEHGLEGATTRRIAERAGVNEVTLFRRFGSKAALLRTALREEASLFGRAAAEHTGDLERDLVQLAADYLGLVRCQHRVLPIAYFEAARRLEPGEDPLEGQREAFRRVAALFGRYQAEGKLRAEPPEQAVVAFLGPIVYAGLIASVAPGAVAWPDPEALVGAYLVGRRGPGLGRGAS